MSFKKTLLTLLEDMKYYHRDKEKLLPMYINERLNDSLQVYYKELSNTVSYLSDKDKLRVLKSLNK